MLHTLLVVEKRFAAGKKKFTEKTPRIFFQEIMPREIAKRVKKRIIVLLTSFFFFAVVLIAILLHCSPYQFCLGLNLGGGVRSFLASRDRPWTTLEWMAQDTQ